MLEIKMTGSPSAGKTQHAVGLAENWLYGGKSVLFVVPNSAIAQHVKGRFAVNNPKLEIIPSNQFNKVVRAAYWDAIIFDDLHKFAVNAEGSYLEIARNRLQALEFSVLAYTVPENPIELLTREYLGKLYAEALDINVTINKENERLRRQVNDQAQEIERLKAVKITDHEVFESATQIVCENLKMKMSNDSNKYAAFAVALAVKMRELITNGGAS